MIISSLQNPRIKQVVALRQRSHRDESGLMLIEGYREIKRAAENGHPLVTLYFCADLFRGGNEQALLDRCREAGAELQACTEPVFRKISYRDRPEGLLATAPPAGRPIESLTVPAAPLLAVAESIEKPGNLGTILRSSDAAGVHAVFVCDRCTDVNNPNVVRASIGTLFTVPVVEASSAAVIEWLRTRRIQVLAATPHAEVEYSDVDLTKGTAIVVGTEQYGLSPEWIKAADLRVRIPMQGQADSLNVAAATTILLFEAVRQRRAASSRPG
jgi:RNA methyltransferase, TrmH family